MCNHRYVTRHTRVDKEVTLNSSQFPPLFALLRSTLGGMRERTRWKRSKRARETTVASYRMHEATSPLSTEATDERNISFREPATSRAEEIVERRRRRNNDFTDLRRLGDDRVSRFFVVTRYTSRREPLERRRWNYLARVTAVGRYKSGRERERDPTFREIMVSGRNFSSLSSDRAAFPGMY